MSRNGSGVYTLPAGNPVVSQTVIASSWANNTMNDLAAAMTDSVAADGQTPMTGSLNLNSNKIVNLATGTIGTDAINYAQFNTPTFGGAVVCSSSLTVTGDTTVGGNLAVNSTGQIKIPNGTTAQRPAIPLNGMVRYNTSLGIYESFNTFAQNSAITTLTNTVLVATATTATAHGLNTGDYVTVSGCTPAAYNGSFYITVTSETQFTYTMLTNPSGSASVIGTYTYGLWSSIGSGGGATGGRGNPVFYENEQTVTVSYTIPATKNAMSAGPITINTGVTVIVSTGATWVIV
jgi:hypothetical protein